MTGISSFISPPYLALTTLGVMCAWPFVAHRVRDPFHILYPFVGYVAFGIGIRGLALQGEVVPNRFNAPVENEQLLALAYILTALALAGLYLGYYGRLDRVSQSMAQALRRRAIADRCAGEGARVGYSLFCATVAFVSFWWFRRHLHLPVVLGHNPAAVAAALMDEGLYHVTMLKHFATVGLALGVLSRRPLARTTAVLMNVCALLLWFSIGGHKGIIIESALVVVIAVHYRVRRLSFAQAIAAGAIGLIVTFFLFQYRSYGVEVDRWTTLDASAEEATWRIIEPILNRSYHCDMLLIILDRVQRGGGNELRLGGTLSELLYFWIPRRVWPSKPLAFGYSFARTFLEPWCYSTTSFATSLVGELFLNWHLIGVVVGFALVGRVMKVGYLLLCTTEAPLMTIGYGILVTRLVFLVEGPIAGHVLFTLSSFLPLLGLAVVDAMAPRLRCRRGTSRDRATAAAAVRTSTKGQELGSTESGARKVSVGP